MAYRRRKSYRKKRVYRKRSYAKKYRSKRKVYRRKTFAKKSNFAVKKLIRQLTEKTNFMKRLPAERMAEIRDPALAPVPNWAAPLMNDVSFLKGVFAVKGPPGLSSEEIVDASVEVEQ